MVAYHFPPILESSGFHRTLHFARYLPEFGWRPIVLTVHPRAYPKRSDALLAHVPQGLRVIRAQAWDAGRHFAWRGRYPSVLALPDRWSTWWVAGVWAGLRAIREARPSVIWSTFSVATAHLIGATLHGLTGIPWVADFRDPMERPDLAARYLLRQVWRAIERLAVRRAARICVTTPSILEMMRNRYPFASKERWAVLENGYDETLFNEIPSAGPRPAERSLRLLHSGVLYYPGRNPIPFLHALRSFLDDSGSKVEVVFRAPGNEINLLATLRDLGLAEVVRVLSPVGYAEAAQEMTEADGLLLIQGPEYNRQIPAKAYEYLRAGRPIVALVDPAGETMRLLATWSCVYTAPMQSEEAIKETLRAWCQDVQRDILPNRWEEGIERLSRRRRTQELAQILGAVAGKKP